MQKNQTPISEIDDANVRLAAASTSTADPLGQDSSKDTISDSNSNENNETTSQTSLKETKPEEKVVGEEPVVETQDFAPQPIGNASQTVFAQDPNLEVVGLLDSSPLSAGSASSVETSELEELEAGTPDGTVGLSGVSTPLTGTSLASGGTSGFTSSSPTQGSTGGNAPPVPAGSEPSSLIEAAASGPLALAASDGPPTVIDNSTGLALSNGEGLAFPSAVGFGAQAEGGRGGEVYIVTNLNDSGPGSLREGVEASGPRTIVFEVDGIIDLETQLVVTNPFLTIAGQTAPGEGITLRNGYLNDDTPLQIRADDVIVRHIRARPGPAGLSEEQVAEARANGLVYDGKEFDGSRLDAIEIKHAENVILDHISASWGSDGTVDTVNADNVTIQYSIIAESLGNSIHQKGSHAVGGSFSYGSENATAAFNLYSDHEWRNPRVNGKGPNLGEDPVFQLHHNVSYNTNSYFVDVMGDAHLNAIGNYFIAGPNADDSLKLEFGFQKYDGYDPKLYLLDNLGPSNGYVLSVPGDSAANWNEGLVADKDTTGSSSIPIGPDSPFYSAIPFSAPEIAALPSDTVLVHVLDNAGAMNLGTNGDRRDDTDLRNVEEVRDGTGRLIDHPDEVGGWSVLEQGVAPEDIDRDGMADDWERSVGLDPNDASDRNGDLFGTGYTNLEIYLAALAGDVTIVPNEGPGEPENQTPVVADISLSGNEDEVIAFAASEFTDAFSDGDGDALNLVRIDSLPANGSLTLDGLAVAAGQEIPAAQLGLLAFLPDADWNGETAFSWSGHDGTDFSAQTASVNLTVDPANDVPVVSDVSLSGSEDQPIAIAASDFTDAFSDGDGDALSLVRIDSLPANGNLTLDGLAVAAGQEIPVAQLALLAFLPDADWNGETAFSWSGHDGTDFSAQAATVNLSVDPANDAPVVSDVSLSGNEDEAIAFTASDFTDAFSDGDGDALSLVRIDSLPANGSLILDGLAVAAGQEIPAAQLALLAFVPDADWNGETAFSWSGQDGTDFSAQAASVNLTVDPQNEFPVVSDISLSGSEDEVIAFAASDFTDAFSDGDGDALSLVRIDSLPANGSLTLDGAAVAAGQQIPFAQLGLLAFLPDADWNGETSFSWSGQDGTAFSLQGATVTLSVGPESDAPVVADFSLSGNEDEAIAFAASDFTDAFSDGDGDALSLVRIDSLPANGSLTLDGAAVAAGQEIPAAQLGLLAFLPDADWNGETSFSWSGQDGTDFSAQAATVTLTLDPVNELPVVSDVSLSGNEDEVIAFAASDFTDAFSDGDGDALNLVRIDSLPANGSLTLDGLAVAAGQEIPAAQLALLAFLPDADWNGETAFSWSGYDGTDFSAQTASVNLTVDPQNDAPVASNDTGFVSREGTSILIDSSDLTRNDNDPEGDLLVVVSVTNAIHGTVLLNGEEDSASQIQAFGTESGTLGDLTPLTNGLVTFIPEDGYSGPAQFDYMVSDGSGATSTATVFIDIEERDAGLELVLTGAEDNAIRFTASDFEASLQDPVLANSLAKIKVTSLPENGALLLNGAAVLAGNEIIVSDLSGLTFQPDANWHGETLFAWTAYGEDDVWTQVLDARMVVESINDWPVATDDSGFIALEDLPLTIPLEEIIANDTDADLDLLAVQSVGDALNGTVTLADDAIIFKPQADFTGDASFDYAISDGRGGYATATVSLTVIENQAEPVELVARSGSLTERDGDQYWGDVKVTAENWDGSAGEVFLSLEYGTRGLSVAGGRSDHQIDFSVVDQDGDGVGGDSERLVFDYGKDIAEVSLQVGRLKASEHGGNVEMAAWEAFDSNGELVGSGLLDPREGLPIGQDLYEFEITADDAFSSLEISAKPYNNLPDNDIIEDSSDFKIAKMTYTPAAEVPATAAAESQPEDFGASLAASESGLNQDLLNPNALDDVIQVM